MIGRNYVETEVVNFEEEMLAAFIDMALDQETLREKSSAEEDYLSLFMAHSSEPVDYHESAVADSLAHDGVDIKFSKFISSYPVLDKGSGIGAVRLTFAVVPPGGMTVQSEDVTLLCYSLTGEGEVIAAGHGIRCCKYDCVWVGCDSRVQFRAAPGKPWECAFIRIHGRPDSHFFSTACHMMRLGELIQLTFGAGTRFRSLIWQLLSARTDASPNSDTVYSHLLLSLFIELELAVVNASAKQVIIPDIIVGMQNYIDRNYGRDIMLDELSRVFNVSKFHMSREFKRYVGKSPNDYLINVRIEKSKELLVDSNRTVAQIAQLVGIPNTNHFLYLFKSREGITPSAFRKRRL